MAPSSTITISNLPLPDENPTIQWRIDGMVAPDGPTLTIPADITAGEHEVQVSFTDSITRSPGGTITGFTTDSFSFKFTIAGPEPDPEPVYTFDPVLNVNQDSGGPTLAPCSTVTISNLPVPELAVSTDWYLDMEQILPTGPILTIPADITPGVHSLFTIVFLSSTLVDGLRTVETGETTFDFTIADPPDLTLCTDPVLSITFVPSVLDNQAAGGLTLVPGSTITVSDLPLPDQSSFTVWQIDGVGVLPDGPTLTIPADIAPGEHEGKVFVVDMVTRSPEGVIVDFTQASTIFKFTIAPPDNEPNPVYTFDPLVFTNQVNGGLTLVPGSTITVTEPVGPNLVDQITWSIAGVAQPDGATLTIPADIAPGEHEGVVIVIGTFSLHGGMIFDSAPETRTFKFTIAQEASAQVTTNPNLNVNQDGGGVTLSACTTVAFVGTVNPDLEHLIAWTIDGEVQAYGKTFEIPANISLTDPVHGIGYTIPTSIAGSDPVIVTQEDEVVYDFTFANPSSTTECPSVDRMFITSPNLNVRQGTGGLELEPGDTVTLSNLPIPSLAHETMWTIDGEEQPTGLILTIPAGLTLAEHTIEYEFPTTFTIGDGGEVTSMDDTTDHTASRIFTFFELPFDITPSILDDHGTGGLTLAPGSTVTLSDLDEPGIAPGIQWSIDGVSQPDGATLTIPTDLMPGPHVIHLVVPMTFTDSDGVESTSTPFDRDNIAFTIAEPQRSSGGGNDWQKKPTFGKSYENTQFQVVENGFVFNGNTLNIVDNWHTEFLKTSSIIGDTNNVKIKVYTDKLLSSATLQLGVPEIGKSSDAETGIYVMFDRNYTSVNDYDIVKIMHEQDEPLINTDETRVSIAPSHCTSDSVDMKCHTISFDFVIMAPLKHDVVAITATDNDRRSTITFINEGVEFLGDSLLESATHDIHQKLGNQAPSETITLTQQDRRYQVWEDNNGYLWTQNDFGTFTQITHPDFVRYDDASSSVMTRINSAFDGMILDEQEKAVLIFDSEIIQGTLDDSFTHVYPTGDKRDNMEILLLDEEARILLLLE